MVKEIRSLRGAEGIMSQKTSRDFVGLSQDSATFQDAGFPLEGDLSAPSVGGPPQKTGLSNKPGLSSILGSSGSILGSPFVVAGRAEAQRCGVSGEESEDFLSEYLVGCWLSPDQHNLALTCTCGSNRARSLLRRERLWRQRIALVAPSQLPALVESVQVSQGAGDLPQVGSLCQVHSLSPEGELLLKELQQRLAAALDELTPLQQKMLYLRYREGLSFADIAAQTGQSAGSVKMLVRRGQRRIVALLEDASLQE